MGGLQWDGSFHRFDTYQIWTIFGVRFFFLVLQLERVFIVFADFHFYTAYTEASQENARFTFMPGYSGCHPSDHYGGHDIFYPTGLKHPFAC